MDGEAEELRVVVGRGEEPELGPGRPARGGGPELPPARGLSEDSRRRYWAMTRHGREVARLESRRLQALVAAARDKDLLSPDPA